MFRFFFNFKLKILIKNKEIIKCGRHEYKTFTKRLKYVSIFNKILNGNLIHCLTWQQPCFNQIRDLIAFLVYYRQKRIKRKKNIYYTLRFSY